MLGCTRLAVRGFPLFAPCLEHICAGGGGGSEANIWYCYIGGDFILRLRIMLLVGMSWADVLPVMLERGVMCDIRHPRQEEAL